MSLVNIRNTQYDISSSDFVSIKSGNWNSPDTWKIRGADGNLYFCPNYPKIGNNIYVESTHTITLTQNESCNDINYINAEDKTSINTGSFNLDIYGILRRYTGSAPGISATAGGGIGTSQWLVGNYTFKGLSRNLPSTGYPSSFNLYGSNFIVDLDSGQTITILDLIGSVAYTLGGTFTVKNGSIFSTGNAQFRVAKTPATLAVADGDVIIESGGKIITERLAPGGVVIGRGASNGFNSFTLNSGAIFESLSSAATVRIVANSHSMNGAVYYSLAGPQNFLLGSSSTPPGITSITTYNEVYLTNSGIKTLVSNITINGKLSLAGTATLALSTFTLNYGSTADLEYTIDYTKGVELPNSSSGVNIPRNLIIPSGITLNLNGGIVNIRGILTGGGSVTNGTLNENQS